MCFYVLANFFMCYLLYCCHYMWVRNIKFGLIRPRGPKDSKLCNGIQAELEGPIWNKGCEKRSIWYIYIYIHGSKIYKSLLKVSPLIWAQKACQKLSKKKKIMQIHKLGPIQSLNLPNRQIQPVQPMTWIAGSNLYIESIVGHIFCNLTQSSRV